MGEAQPHAPTVSDVEVVGTSVFETRSSDSRNERCRCDWVVQREAWRDPDKARSIAGTAMLKS
jgi:hypothetical protein